MPRPRTRMAWWRWEISGRANLLLRGNWSGSLCFTRHAGGQRAKNNFIILCKAPDTGLYTNVFSATETTFVAGTPQTFTLATPTDFTESRLVTTVNAGGDGAVQFRLCFSATAHFPGSTVLHTQIFTAKTLAATTSVTAPQLNAGAVTLNDTFLGGDATARAYPSWDMVNSSSQYSNPVANQPYGKGFWRFTSSSIVNGGFVPEFGFWPDLSMGGNWCSAFGRYDGTTGNYVSSVSTLDNNGAVHLGEFWQVMPPTPKHITSVRIIRRFAAPRSFVILGTMVSAVDTAVYYEHRRGMGSVAQAQTFNITDGFDVADMRIIIRVIVAGTGETVSSLVVAFTVTTPGSGAATFSARILTGFQHLCLLKWCGMAMGSRRRSKSCLCSKTLECLLRCCYRPQRVVCATAS
ncbi:hypothetical protein DFJ77DRAFT_104703 [Powellomyces hirtus]|nr:hypothetical protein DFJ77DRAFT_104703 [Powellomyces hirtus]